MGVHVRYIREGRVTAQRFNTFDECSSKKVWRQMAKEMRRMKNEKDRESQQGGHAKTEAAPTLALKVKDRIKERKRELRVRVKKLGPR
ncbi:hypothetical protein TSAR_001918 [Trichomalopsis sarcophagae]|uniref:Uncharacterized protein n=1 Tax=Trichomalopsis sarcophagae TaxID=543379 RepID=A0A232F5L7_9HYME|nr:hypothetical protein TSAR_001918 [Trichomalopsis sarcophagae]